MRGGQGDRRTAGHLGEPVDGLPAFTAEFRQLLRDDGEHGLSGERSAVVLLPAAAGGPAAQP